MPLHLQSLQGFFTRLVPFLITLSRSLLLAFVLDKLWCQARALLTPVSLATKMSASKLIRYFSSHPAAFGFQASTPPNNISLNFGQQEGWSVSFRFPDWSGHHCTCYSWHRAAHFSSPGCPGWYPFLPARGWGRCYSCFWSACITSPDSWHFGQGCFQASWKFSTYSSTFV